MADALMVTSSFLPGRGGIESYLAELCALLSPRVAVLAPPRRDGSDLPSDLPYPAIPGPDAMLWPRREVFRAVRDHARSQDTDKIIFGTPWPLALLGPRLHDAGFRYAVIVHGAELVAPGATPLLRGRMARALALAELLLPVSDYTARATADLLRKQRLGLPRMERLRARVDVRRFRPNPAAAGVRAGLGVAPDAKVVLCFGRLVPRKGVHRLVDVMPEVTRRVPGAVLVVGGTGPEESKLRRRAARRGAGVVFAGRVADADAPLLYATADVFALPVVDRWFGLEMEGLGVVLLEASACGTPCVTGTSGGTPEAVLDNETGFVIDATDRRWLTNAIVQLLVDDRLRHEMGVAAREHVEREFSSSLPPKPLLDWMR